MPMTGRLRRRPLLRMHCFCANVLLRCHILMAPMDGEAPWLRYHQLLRDHLLARVAPRLGVDAALMHGRAAQWFAQRGMWLDAVRHALQAGDTQQAVKGRHGIIELAVLEVVAIAGCHQIAKRVEA